MGNIAKCVNALVELKEKLRLRHEGHVTKGKTPTGNSVRNSVDRILSPEHMKEIFDYEITGEPGQCPELKYELNMNRFDALKERKFFGQIHPVHGSTRLDK
jgi:hypothetical protein